MTRLVVLLALVLLVWLFVGVPLALLVILSLGYAAVYLQGFIDGRRNRQTAARLRRIAARVRLPVSPERQPWTVRVRHRADGSGTNGHVDESLFRRKGG